MAQKAEEASAQCPQPTPMYTRPLWRRDEAFILPANCTSPCFLPPTHRTREERMNEKLVKMAAQFFENNKEEWSLIFWGA